MATQAAIRLAAQINDIADMPYALARPFLLKIQSPQQLRDIEINCPHIAEADEELWRAFIARDIPDWQTKIVEPKNKNSWHKVYRYLQRKEELKAAEDEENLRKTMAGEGLKKAEKKTLFVDKVLPHARAEDEHNFFIDGVARKDLNDWGIQKKPPSLKNAKTGKDIMSALRRRAAEPSRARAMAKPFAPQTSARKLANAKSQITQAPPTTVRQAAPARPLTIAPREQLPHEKAMMAEFNKKRAATKIQPPGKMSTVKYAEQNQHRIEAATRKAREENEAKLKALTQNTRRASTTSSPPSKPYDFAPSPIVVDPAKRASPPKMPPACVMASATNTPAASPPGTKASSPPSQPMATTTEPHFNSTTSISPEASSPPKMVKKRPAPGSIFMNTNKKRKI